MANSLIQVGGSGPAGSDGQSVDVRDEGVQLTTACRKMDFVGDGVTVTEPIADEVVVTIPASGALVKTSFDEVTVDTTTTASITSPATLLSIAITPDDQNNKFCVYFSASAEVNTESDTKVVFQIWYGLTGSEAQKRSSYIFSDNGTDQESGSCSLNMRLDALGAGEHTIQIRWGCTSSTARIRPVANPDYDHASLLVQEVNT